MKKQHIPSPGRASGLSGIAVCGRGATFTTGDHDLIRRLAKQAVRESDAGHYCQTCLRSL